MTVPHDARGEYRREATDDRPRACSEPAVEGFLCVDPEGRLTFVGEPAGRILGYEPGELLGADLYRLFYRSGGGGGPHHEDGGPVYRTLRAGEGSRASRDVFRRKDGTPVRVECSSEPIVEGDEVRGAAVTIVDLGGRERAEEIRSRHAAILEGTTDFVGVADAGGRVLSVNRAGKRMLGIDEDEDLEGTMVTDYHPDWACEVVIERGIPAAVREGAWSGETALRARDGAEIPVSQVILCHRGPDGEVRFLSTTARDITARKRAEEERERLLRESERRAADLDAVVRSIPDAVYVGDESGIRVCNDAALEMLGFESISELNRDIPALSERLQNRFAGTGERILPQEEPFARALGGETVVAEVISRHLKTGRDIIVRCAAAPIRREGKILGAVAVNTDVTEQKEAERRLAYHARLLENTHDAVLTTDERLVVTGWNPGAEEMYGWTAGEVLGRDLREVLGSGFTDEERAEALREVAETGRFDRELTVRRRDGTPIRVETAFLAMRGEGGGIAGYLGIYRDVTERREAEEALRESHRRIEDTLESITDSFYALDREWRYTYVNEQALRTMGAMRGEELSREDLLGKNMWEVFPEVAGTVFDREYREALREQKTAEFEAYYPPGDTWFEVHAYPSEEGLSVYFRDVGQRKRIEEALRDSEERFQALVSATFEGIAVHDGGVMIEVNDALARMFGYEPGELVGKSALELTAPESREIIRGNIASGYEAPYEAVGLRKDGTRLEVELRGRPFEYKGRTVRATAIRDVTERKAAEEALRRSEELYRTVVEQAAENIFVLDARTKRVLEANAALQRSLGYTPEEMSRLTLYDIVAHDRESIDRNTERVLEEGRAFLGERKYRRKDGTLADVEVSVSAIPYGSREAMSVVAHDVTERKRAEEALMEIREGERRRIARDLHDVVLQDIAGALQGLQAARVERGEADDGPDLGREAEALRRAVGSLRDAIYDLRSDESRRFVRAAESLVELNRQLSPGRELRLVVGKGFPDELPDALGGELLRVLQEALINARRHSGARRVVVILDADADGVRAEVVDDGCGFDPGAAGRGFGIRGMRERALALGGGLRIESEPGRGTRVVVRIPGGALPQG